MQQETEQSVSTLSKDVAIGINNCNRKIEDLKELPRQTELPCDFSLDIKGLSKKVDTQFGNMNVSIQAVERSIMSLQNGFDNSSKECKTQCQLLEVSDKQLQESLTEIKTDMSRVRQTITDMEKTLTVISEGEDFSRPNKSTKAKTNDEEIIIVSDSNIYKGLEEEGGDLEVTFKNVDSGVNREINEIDKTLEVDEGMRNGSVKKPTKTPRHENTAAQALNRTETTARRSTQSARRNEMNEQRTIQSKREKIYLIGDSISGQVNPALLGKATKSYVQKLKAPKIDDLQKLTDHVKDAKMIIIHTGINNLRQKEAMADPMKTLITAVASFKEEAPDSKIVISKAIPIGNHEIDIERNIYNAESEKKLREVLEQEVTFLDHGNLAERGMPIKKYYRQDLIHLSNHGVAVFAQNLEKEISNSLWKDGKRDVAYQRDTRPSLYQDGARSRGREYQGDKERASTKPYRSSYSHDNNRNEYYRQGSYRGRNAHGNWDRNDRYNHRKKLGNLEDDRYRYRDSFNDNDQNSYDNRSRHNSSRDSLYSDYSRRKDSYYYEDYYDERTGCSLRDKQFAKENDGDYYFHQSNRRW